MGVRTLAPHLSTICPLGQVSPIAEEVFGLQSPAGFVQTDLFLSNELLPCLLPRDGAYFLPR